MGLGLEGAGAGSTGFVGGGRGMVGDDGRCSSPRAPPAPAPAPLAPVECPFRQAGSRSTSGSSRWLLGAGNQTAALRQNCPGPRLRRGGVMTDDGSRPARRGRPWPKNTPPCLLEDRRCKSEMASCAAQARGGHAERCAGSGRRGSDRRSWRAAGSARPGRSGTVRVPRRPLLSAGCTTPPPRHREQSGVCEAVELRRE